MRHFTTFKNCKNMLAFHSSNSLYQLEHNCHKCCICMENKVFQQSHHLKKYVAFQLVQSKQVCHQTSMLCFIQPIDKYVAFHSANRQVCCISFSQLISMLHFIQPIDKQVVFHSANRQVGYISFSQLISMLHFIQPIDKQVAFHSAN